MRSSMLKGSTYRTEYASAFHSRALLDDFNVLGSTISGDSYGPMTMLFAIS